MGQFGTQMHQRTVGVTEASVDCIMTLEAGRNISGSHWWSSKLKEISDMACSVISPSFEKSPVLKSNSDSPHEPCNC